MPGLHKTQRQRHRQRPGQAGFRLRLEALEDRSLPSTVTWINPAGGDWDTAANWDANRVPTAADDAVIDVAGITVTHSLSNSDSAHSLTSAADLAISNGSLSLGAASEVDGLNLTGGTLTGPGTLTIDAALAWTGGTMSGTGHTVLNGTATVGGGVFGPLLDTRTLDNAGTANVLEGASVRFLDNAAWNNQDGATLVLQGNSALGNFFGQSGQLNNAGLLIKSGVGNATSNLAIPFMNSGTVDVQTGTLSVNQSLTNSGTFALEVGALATLAGAGSSSGDFQLAADSRVDITANFTELSGATVELAANSILNIGASFGSASLTLQDGASVSGPGTVQITGFFGALNVNGEASLDHVVASGFFTNLNVNGNAQITSLVLSSGTATITGNTGSLEVQDLTQTGGTLTGPGTLTVDSTLTWTGGTMSGTGHTVLNGSATIGSGFGMTLDTRTVDNSGTATVADGATLGFTNGAVWNNKDGGTLVLRGSASLGGFLGQSGRLNNAGLVVRSGTDSSRSGINIRFDNTGTVDVQTGTLSVVGVLTNEGIFNLDVGALASLAAGSSSSGAFNLAADSRLDVPGNFTQLSLATVTLAAGSILNVSSSFDSGTYTMQDGATVSGPGTLQVNGSFFGSGGLNVNGDVSIDNLAVGSGTVTIAAAGSLAVGNLTLSGGTVTVPATGSLEVQNLTQTGGTLTGAGTATVDGVLTWTAGTMSGTGHTVLNGTATIGGGVFGPILDTRMLDNAGTATVPNGATLRFANNAVWGNQVSGTLVLQGSATLGNFFGQSGQLENAGLLLKTGAGSQATINIPVINKLGTVDIQGTLTINGNYTQTVDASLNLHIGGLAAGTQYDQLQINGLASLAGTLNITLVNDFSPVEGNSFRIITFNSRSGDFTTKNFPDLGGGLFFDPVYDSSGLTLVTRSS